MRHEQVLAIDQGTQSVRAAVFDLHGNMIACSQVRQEPYFSAQPGWAEQHPTYFWDRLCQACQQLWREPGVDRGALAGMALTSQRGTVINVDRNGDALRPAMVWLDQRRATGLRRVGGPWGILFRLIGMADTIAYIQSQAEANWIRTEQSDIWERTHKYLMLSGYLAYRLTGRFADSVGAQVGYMPFDYKQLRWAAAWDWKWRAIPMDRSLLPDLVPPATQLGEVSAAAAEATGIPVGLPLIAAATDKACEALGAGCISPEMACLSYGTSASVIVTASRYREVRPMIPPFPAALPNSYNLEVQVYRGYWMVEWFKQQFGHLEQTRAREEGRPVEEFLDGLVDQVPPGSLGLVLQPYWSPGLRVPGPEAKGAIIGFSDRHTRAHVYRAMLEGLAYALREGKEQIERRTRTPIRTLRVAGGGSRSAAALQLTADIFGLPVSRPHVYEASALGAAINAAVGTRLHATTPVAVAEMTRARDVFEPSPQAQAIYEELYKRVYLRMYRGLKPLYEELRQMQNEEVAP